tara:strand:+ start:1357 stop:3651 length:2295 start_codon:yes stop_codon:yes gene_type:complete
MTNIHVVTCINETILKQSAPYFFNLVKDKWDPSIPLTCYYHDCATAAYDLPIHIRFRNLHQIQGHEDFQKTFADHDGTEKQSIPYNDKLDALRWSHKVFALADKADDMSDGWLIWIDADIYLQKRITKEYLVSLLDDKADVVIIREDPFFLAYNLSKQPVKDLIADLKKTYVSGEMINYREWHDTFILDRLLNIYVTHGLKYHIIEREQLNRIFHFRGDYNDKKLTTIRDEKGERLHALSDTYSPDITPGRYKQLSELIKHYKPKTILETGTWNGGRAVEMSLAAFEYTDTVTYYGFDLFEEASIESDKKEFNSKAHNKLSAVENRLKEFSEKMKEKNKTFIYSLTKGNSKKTLAEFKTTPIDFALVGGGNSFQTVENDYNNVSHADVIVFDHWFREDDNKRIPSIEYQGVNQLIEKINKTVKVKKEILPSGDQVLGGGHTHLAVLINKKSLPDLPPSLRQVPIHVNPRDCVPKDYIHNNITANVKKILENKWLPKCKPHNGTALIVSGGPKLDCNKIKEALQKYPNAKVVCVKHSHPILLDNGIIPWGCVVLDPRPITGTSTHGVLRKDLFKTVDPSTKFLVASMTDPSVTEYLQEKNADIWGWHAFTESLREPEEQKKGIQNNTVKLNSELGIKEGSTLITGGTCAAMRAIGIMHTMGFRSMHLFGFDCSLKEEPTKEMKKQTTGAEDEEPRPKYFQVGVRDKNYWTTGELLAMAQDCEKTFSDKSMGINYTFHGENTLAADLWKIAEQKDTMIAFGDVFND